MPRQAMARKIVYSVAVSADGFIARPDGAVDWLDRPRPKGGYGMAKFFQSVDTLVLGRKTYDFAVKHGRKDVEPEKKNYVFSRTKKKLPSAKVELVSGDVKGFAKRLRAEKGKNIWVMGGGEIAAAFLDAGELDEIVLHVIPVLIGEGIPLFGPRQRQVPLDVLRTESFPDGVIQVHCRVKAGVGQKNKKHAKK
jgi:dihydrofolate reductase